MWSVLAVNQFELIYTSIQRNIFLFLYLNLFKNYKIFQWHIHSIYKNCPWNSHINKVVMMKKAIQNIPRTTAVSSFVMNWLIMANNG